MTCTCDGSVISPCVSCAHRGLTWFPTAQAATVAFEDVLAAMNKLPTYETCKVCAAQLPLDRLRCGTCLQCDAYLDGVRDGVAAGAWKATLERDIAEVERALREWKDSAVRLQVEAEEASATSRYEAIYGRRKQWGHGRESDAMIDRRVAGAATLYAEARMYRDMAADCEAWLVRARTVMP